ncbi:hypothetical protein [Nonomuraea fuscirosea]|uniref:hypothetical protein n=1 Tax=Nonomuraea fuscirosea TaxID=1291556 RepID=UPI0011B20917|nr:hypothetical protein [Nonomuraea fuscirosea]
MAALGITITDATTGALSTVASGIKSRIFDGPPVRVTKTIDFVSQERERLRRSSYILPGRSIASMGPPPKIDMEDYAARAAWAKQNNAVDAYNSYIRVVVDAPQSKTVVLTGLRVRVLQRRPPPSGVAIDAIGAGPIVTRSFFASLDEEQSRIEYMEPEEIVPGQERAIDFPFRISNTEPEVFLIITDVQKFDVDWQAELTWVADGKAGRSVIDDEGKPFRTASAANAPMYTPTAKGWKKVGD